MGNTASVADKSVNAVFHDEHRQLFQYEYEHINILLS